MPKTPKPKESSQGSGPSVASPSSSAPAAEVAVENSVQVQALDQAQPQPAQDKAPDNTQKAAKLAETQRKGELSKLVNKFDWTGGDKASVLTKGEAAWTSAFVPAYAAALDDGKSAKAAGKAARKEAAKAPMAIYEAEAVKVAHARAAALQGDSAAFSGLDGDAQSAMDKYNKDDAERGGVAKRLATALNGKDADTMESLVDAEAGGTREDSTLGCNKPQIAWNFPDGSLVRVKPEGDNFGDDAMFCVEVLKDNAAGQAGQDDVAFKIDDQARAVPKGPGDIDNPYANKHKPQQDAFAKVMIEAGHRKTA